MLRRAAPIAAACLLSPAIANAQYGQPPPPGYGQPPPPGYGQPPPPGYGQPPPPGYGQPPPPGYGQPPPGHGGYGGYQQPPPPPPPPQDDGYERPDISIRADPLNAIIEGRLRIETEVELLDWMSVEVMPTFVVWQKPPLLNLRGRQDNMSQEGNLAGALAGGRLGIGFWPSGEVFDGYVVRIMYSGEHYRFVADRNLSPPTDRLALTNRRIFFFFGSHRRWNFFTIAGGFGLGIEMHRQQRCFDSVTGPPITSGCGQVAGGDSDEVLLALDPNRNEVVNVNGGLHPVYLEGRFSVGVVF